MVLTDKGRLTFPAAWANIVSNWFRNLEWYETLCFWAPLLIFLFQYLRSDSLKLGYPFFSLVTLIKEFLIFRRRRRYDPTLCGAWICFGWLDRIAVLLVDQEEINLVTDRITWIISWWSLCEQRSGREFQVSIHFHEVLFMKKLGQSVSCIISCCQSKIPISLTYLSHLCVKIASCAASFDSDWEFHSPSTTSTCETFSYPPPGEALDGGLATQHRMP